MKWLIIFLSLAVAASVSAQQVLPADSATPKTLFNALTTGKLQAQARYAFMTTDNAPGLRDYYAHALAAGLKYETAPFKNVQFGLSNYTVFNMGSSNLAAADERTGQKNRYEAGLFQIENPQQKILNRFEELYVKYQAANTTLTAGKQLLTTPFINLQDGRMRPTAVEGLWATTQVKKTKLEAGVLSRISPRSTDRWYSVAGSMGVYPQGVNPDGTRADYAHHLKSRGLALAGITHQLSKSTKLQLWEQYTDNVFNSLLLQATYQTRLKDSSRLLAEVQLIQQNALHNGGNADPQKAYFPKGAQSLSLSSRLAWQVNHWEWTAAYTRITAEGR